MKSKQPETHKTNGGGHKANRGNRIMSDFPKFSFPENSFDIIYPVGYKVKFAVPTSRN